MSFFKISMAALFLFFLGLAITSEAEPNFLYYNCSGTIFSPESTYQSNLNHLLSSLASNSTRNNNGFYNTTIGQTPDTVYGLFLCRGDLSTDVCQDCVTFAAKDVVQKCPAEKVSVIWYDECLLRYSNQSFFNNVGHTVKIMYNGQNSIYQPNYQELVLAMMNDLASQASNTSEKFRATNFPWSHGSLYTLVQCTQDLSESNCQTCLRLAIAKLPDGPIGARIMTLSCIIRYETYLFYNQSGVPGNQSVSPPLPSLSPSPLPLYLPSPPLHLPPPASRTGNF